MNNGTCYAIVEALRVDIGIRSECIEKELSQRSDTITKTH